jgi:hypothetical protein
MIASSLLLPRKFGFLLFDFSILKDITPSRPILSIKLNDGTVVDKRSDSPKQNLIISQLLTSKRLYDNAIVLKKGIITPRPKSSGEVEEAISRRI